MRSAMTLAVAVAFAAAGTAAAQGRGGFGRFGGGPSLVTNESVQGELKLTDDQKKKAEEFGTKFREKMQDVRDNAQGDFDKMMKEMTKANTEAMKELAEKKVLTDEQMKRFKQIVWQVGGLNSLATDDELQKTVKLTDDGKAKFKKMSDELREKTMALFQDGPGPELQKKMTDLRKEFNDKATESLTADQKKAYKDALGKAFEVKFPQRQ